jgi:hypothetical protein
MAISQGARNIGDARPFVDAHDAQTRIAAMQGLNQNVATTGVFHEIAGHFGGDDGYRAAAAFVQAQIFRVGDSFSAGFACLTGF